MRETILETLAERHQCFISSLSSLAGTPGMLHTLRGLQDSGYSPEEWGYCLTYLYRREIQIKNERELEAFLKEEERRAFL